LDREMKLEEDKLIAQMEYARYFLQWWRGWGRLEDRLYVTSLLSIASLLILY